MLFVTACMKVIYFFVRTFLENYVVIFFSEVEWRKFFHFSFNSAKVRNFSSFDIFFLLSTLTTF